MSVNSTVRVRLSNVPTELENKMSVSIRMMMEDIHTLSTPITPKRPDPIGGTLRAAVSKQMVSPTMGIIKWHAPYAEYQERGFTTGPVVNYSTPGTHAHFIEESVNQVVNNLQKYLAMGGLL